MLAPIDVCIVTRSSDLSPLAELLIKGSLIIVELSDSSRFSITGMGAFAVGGARLLSSSDSNLRSNGSSFLPVLLKNSVKVSRRAILSLSLKFGLSRRRLNIVTPSGVCCKTFYLYSVSFSASSFALLAIGLYAFVNRLFGRVGMRSKDFRDLLKAETSLSISLDEASPVLAVDLSSSFYFGMWSYTID